MPYGRPYSSGHGYRVPICRWTPSLYPYARRKRRKRRMVAEPPKTGSNHSLRKTCLKLVGNSMLELMELLLDIVHQGGPTNRAIALLCDVAFAAVLFSSEISLALGLIVLGLRLSDVYVKETSNELVKNYKEKTKAIRIQRKTSVNPPPTPAAIRRAWEASRTSLAGKLLAGTLLSDLEPVVDQSYIRDEDGTIVGRRPGIKGWLLANCPDMLPHYKVLMNYKALADKLRKALGIEDPDTLAGVLDFSMGMLTETESEKTLGTEGISPKSLVFLDEYKLMNSNEINIHRNIYELFGVFGGETRDGPDRMQMPQSMAALDAVLRERLGLVWMRRTRKQALSA